MYVNTELTLPKAIAPLPFTVTPPVPTATVPLLLTVSVNPELMVNDPQLLVVLLAVDMLVLIITRSFDAGIPLGDQFVAVPQAVPVEVLVTCAIILLHKKQHKTIGE